MWLNTKWPWIKWKEGKFRRCRQMMIPGIGFKWGVLFCGSTLAQVHGGSDVIHIQSLWLSLSVPVTGTLPTLFFFRLKCQTDPLCPSWNRKSNWTELTCEIRLSLKFQSKIICFLKEMMPLYRKLYPNKVDTVGIQSNVVLCLRKWFILADKKVQQEVAAKLNQRLEFTQFFK